MQTADVMTREVATVLPEASLVEQVTPLVAVMATPLSAAALRVTVPLSCQVGRAAAA